MQYSFRLLVISTLVLCSTFARSQDQLRVHVSNDDPRWGEAITVSYVAPQGSPFLETNSRDTVYCAAGIDGVQSMHYLILPMRHVHDSTFETSLAVPDSTHSLRIEICTPTDRLPNGITEFTCRTADGRFTPGSLLESTLNIDSALDAELVAYPKRYSAFPQAYTDKRNLEVAGLVHMDESDWRMMLLSLAERLKATPDTTASWYLSLAALYDVSNKHDFAQQALRDASRLTSYDPIYNESQFWNHFFAPHLKNGKISVDREMGRLIAPLVAKFPNTYMASTWLRMNAPYDTLGSADLFRKVSQKYAQSQDVDLLSAVANGFAYAKNPAHDAATALRWSERAENSWRSHAGFFSGENIYGSMGRIGSIFATRINILAQLNRMDEAVKAAEIGRSLGTQQYDKQLLTNAIAQAYLETGHIEAAKRAYGVALAQTTRGEVDGLSDLYLKAKQGNETQQEFSKRLVDTYGKTVDLPTLPNFEFTTIDGIQGSLAAFRGKVVVLDCWFISCAGCVMEKASLNKLVDSYNGDTNVVFLSIALDDKKQLQHYLTHTESKFKIIPNGRELCEKLQVTGYPTHIILGKDGKTLGFELGGSVDGGELMRPKIDQALAVK